MLQFVNGVQIVPEQVPHVVAGHGMKGDECDRIRELVVMLMVATIAVLSADCRRLPFHLVQAPIQAPSDVPAGIEGAQGHQPLVVVVVVIVVPDHHVLVRVQIDAQVFVKAAAVHPVFLISNSTIIRSTSSGRMLVSIVQTHAVDPGRRRRSVGSTRERKAVQGAAVEGGDGPSSILGIGIRLLGVFRGRAAAVASTGCFWIVRLCPESAAC